MCGEKKSFVAYTEWGDYVNELSNEDAGVLFKALFDYVENGTAPKLSGEAKMAFLVMKNTVARDAEKWEKTREARAKAGKKGGESSGKARADEANEANACFAEQNEANEAVNVNVNVNDNVNVNVNDNVNENVPSGALRAAPGEEEKRLEEQFDMFWFLYPKKIAKKNAFRIWKKLDPDEELYNTVIDSLHKQRHSVQWNTEKGRYIPYPAAWLEGRRWEDELTPIPKEDFLFYLDDGWE